MNDKIAHIIDNFCIKSANYCLPGAIQAQIYCLEYLIKEWYGITRQPMLSDEKYYIYRENLLSNLHKTIINLIEKFSQCRLISGDIIKIFNNVVVNYIESITHDQEQINELSVMFGKISLSDHDENNELTILMSKLNMK